jgi:hypothetical protein
VPQTLPIRGYFNFHKASLSEMMTGSTMPVGTLLTPCGVG